MAQHPLQWASNHSTLEWTDGVRQDIAATTVGDPYVLPKGSSWRMNPLPHSDQNHSAQFTPPCGSASRTEQSCCSWAWPSVTGTPPCTKQSEREHCCFGRDPFDVLILDTLRIPRDLLPGDYVLGYVYFGLGSGHLPVHLPVHSALRLIVHPMGGPTLPEGRLYRMLIGALCPMLSPSNVFRHRWDCEISAQIWQQCSDVTISV